jgi:Ca2+-binding EF-hand superfamily protein
LVTTNRLILQETPMLEEKDRFERLQEHLKATFTSYDTDSNGILDSQELRIFLDDMRDALWLEKCDDAQFNEIWGLLDIDGSKTIDWEKFSQNIPRIFPILSEPTEKMMKKITSIWKDFDVDDSGYLEKNEWTLFLKLMCDKLGVERCTPWQIDYIISIFDLNNDGVISIGIFFPIKFFQ